MRFFSTQLLLFLVLGLMVLPAGAADFVVPPLTGPVVDDAQVLGRNGERVISSALRALREKGGSQITVLTVRSLEGLPIEQASIRVVDQWKLGGLKTDNGVLLLIAPNERKLRIEVGQGLEGVLTDADSKRIIDQSMRPLLRSGDFDSAVIVGVYQIALKTDPDIDLTPYLEGKLRGASREPGEGVPVRVWMILAILVLFFFLGGGHRGRRSRFYGWGPGGWGGGSFGGGGGRGWGGGSGGGGWSGGGGGFSGGGASGDW